MAEISDDSLYALVTVLQQVLELAQLNIPHLDTAPNRQTVGAFITMVSDIVTQAGIDPLSLQRQRQSRVSRRRRSSSTAEYRPPNGNKRPRLAIRLQEDRHRSVDTSSSPSPERESTLEQRLKGLSLAEHIMDELRKVAESNPLARARSFEAPVPPKKLKEGGKQDKTVTVTSSVTLLTLILIISGTPVHQAEDMEKFMCAVITKYYQVQNDQAAAIGAGTFTAYDTLLLPAAQYSQKPQILGGEETLKDVRLPTRGARPLVLWEHLAVE